VKKAIVSNGLFFMTSDMWSGVNKDRHYVFKQVNYRCIVMSYPKVLDKFMF